MLGRAAEEEVSLIKPSIADSTLAGLNIWANETAKSRDFHERISSSNMRLLTVPGTITYSNSQDESIRSSTIDLTFASEEIVPYVVYCRVHRAHPQSRHQWRNSTGKRVLSTSGRALFLLTRLVRPRSGYAVMPWLWRRLRRM